MGWEDFEVDDHASAMEHGKLEGQKMKEEEYKRVRSEVKSVYTPDQYHDVERSTKYLNQWLTVVPNAVDNSVLGKDKFCNTILLQYKIVPKELPKGCDGCGKCHTLQHALQCKVGGLVTACHNKSRDDLGLTASQAYTPSATCDKPKVLTCRECSIEGECPESVHHQDTPDLPVSVIKVKDKEKDPNIYGDLLICSLWKPQTDAIIDVHITDTDT
eukprot:13889192-Ditylum_brightwellii.AAC.1